MRVFLEKGTLKGTINAIGSKSFAHRLLIAAFLANKVETLIALYFSWFILG